MNLRAERTEHKNNNPPLKYSGILRGGLALRNLIGLINISSLGSVLFVLGKNCGVNEDFWSFLLWHSMSFTRWMINNDWW